MSNLGLELSNDQNKTIEKESNELLKNSIETAIILEESSENLNNNTEELLLSSTSSNSNLNSNSINSLPTPPVTESNTLLKSVEESIQSEPIVIMSEEIKENNDTIMGGDLDNVIGAGVAIDGNMSAEMEDSLAPPSVITNGNRSNGTHDSPIVEKETLLSPVTPIEALTLAQSIPLELLPSLEPSPLSTPPVVEPPAPIGAPEILPPPPTQPLPTFSTPQILPPTLQRVDSISSVVVEPPTPSASILIPPPTPMVFTPTYVEVSTPISIIQTPVASTSASPISIPSTTVSTPLPQASTSNLVQSYTTLPIEDTIMSEVSDSPINKRSAEESLEEGQGEAKRARVEPEAYTFAAAPEPVISPPIPSPTPVYAAPTPTPAPAYIPPPVAVAAPIPASTFFAEATPIASTSTAPIPTSYVPAAPVQVAPVVQQQYYQQPQPQEFPKQEVVAPSFSAVAPNPYEVQAPVAFAAAPIAAPVIQAPVGPEGPVAVLNKEQHKWALSLVRTLKKNRQAPPFLKPVDPVALLIPDYFRVVTKPMDLGTVETKLISTGKAMALALKHGKIYGLDYSLGMGLWEGSTGCGEVYRTCQEFKEDVERVWENCFKYNGPKDKNPVSAMAGALQEVCEKMFLNSPYAPEIVYNPPPPVVVQPQVQQQPVYVKPEVRRQSVSSSHRASMDSSVVRPKRETQVPARVADFDEAGTMKAPRQPKISSKAASEQLKFCKEVMKELFKKNHSAYAFVFYEPVDYMSLNIPQYPSIVKRPIDLGTIRNKLDAGQYPIPPFPAFEADMRLLFKNCYLFNPPGTPVHEWGKLVEGVFETKWEERPLSVDYEDESDDEQLHDLERQLVTLQHSIATIKANKRAQKEERKAAERLARPPKAPKVPRQPHSNNHSDPNRHRNSTTNISKRGRGSGGGVGHSVGPGRKRKNHKKDEWDSDQEDEVANNTPSTSSAKTQEVTFDMKRELAVRIVSFEGDALEKAIDIIRRGRPELLGDANKEIELDIDQLDQSTLLALYRYVCPAPKKPVNKRRTSNAPAPKRKSMDEMKESERIRDLEARLREFEGNANAGGGGNDRRGSNAGNGGGGGGGGDQASSSSSSEGESESESEED